MRSDCHDGDLTFARAVIPEDTIGSRGVLFGVGLENVFVVGAG